VEIVDECRDMPAAYMLADVVVSASTSPEGFGRVVVEAQAMGRPVVATNHGGARETVEPGRTGWLVPPGDARALADAIAEALRLTPEERIAHAARAADHVRRNFDTATMAARTLDVYQEVLFPAATAKRAARAALA
jgi:glycosyltransferase involved in cell wall biosynthesis